MPDRGEETLAERYLGIDPTVRPDPFEIALPGSPTIAPGLYVLDGTGQRQAAKSLAPPEDALTGPIQEPRPMVEEEDIPVSEPVGAAEAVKDSGAGPPLPSAPVAPAKGDVLVSWPSESVPRVASLSDRRLSASFE